MMNRTALALKKPVEKWHSTRGARLSFANEKRLTDNEQQGALGNYSYKGFQVGGDRNALTQNAGPFGEGIHGKGKGNIRLYYGGGKHAMEESDTQKARAWRELRSNAISTIEAGPETFASSEPLAVKKKKSKTVVDWENMTMDMPVAGTSISSRKHSTLEHLARLRQNPKYRWKQERFVVRKAAAISHLAQNGYRPELLALNKRTKPPKHINLDTQPVVFVDEYALMAAGGGEGTEGMIAEYFIPEEPIKAELFNDANVTLNRVAVLVGIKDASHLGTMIRSAVGLGCDAIILMEGCADPYSQQVLDVSMAANVTAGGHPRFHVFREEDGDDPWGILNRMIKKHNMIPVLSATATEDLEASVTPDSFWRERHDEEETSANLCIFFGDDKHGLDVDYCKHNVAAATHQLTVPSASTLGLSASAQSAVLLHSLMEPTYVTPNPPARRSLYHTDDAKVRVMAPITREIREAKQRGTPLPMAEVREPTMKINKFYKSQRMGTPAYKTEVEVSMSPAQAWQEALESGGGDRTGRTREVIDV